MVEDNGYLLYKQGIQSEFFTFILDGKAEVYSGRQKFRSEVSRFTILCPEMLSQTQSDFSKGLEFSAFVPDFTARVIQNSRILRLSREDFHKCLEGKLRNYRRPYKKTKEKIREKSQTFKPPKIMSEMVIRNPGSELAAPNLKSYSENDVKKARLLLAAVD